VDELRHTALTAEHERAGAKLAAFAGWTMPIQFSGTIAEHEAVRNAVGIFDVSHLGTVWVTGPAARAVVAATFTNDPAGVEVGGSQYTLCCDERGGIVDDLIVYRVADERWLAVPNAANTTAVVDALRAATADHPDVTIADESAEWAVLAIQGPDSLALVDRLLPGFADAPSAAAVAHLGVAELATDPGPLLLCRTGYTGEVGVELVVPNALALDVWRAAVDAGAVPCGLGARDTLRLEMGYPLHGNDLSTEVSPYEARLGWAVKLDRDDFRGRDALVKAKKAGLARKLLGLRVDGRRPPRPGMRLRDGALPVGVVTSGSYAPTLGCGIGLALLDDPVAPGDRITLDVRGTDVDVEIVRPPFVDRDPKAG
jgi:aminomethyltransferase